MKSRQNTAVSDDSTGAVHADLMGSSAALRFRPRRLSSDALNFDINCRFSIDEKTIGPLPIANVSPTGIAVSPSESLIIAPGTPIDDLQLLYRDSPVWEGKAVSVYQVDGSEPRVGFRFVSRLLDLHLLEVNDSVVESRLDHNLELHRQTTTDLPAPWRASVAAFRRMLQDLKALLATAEKELGASASSYSSEQDAIFERVFSKWSSSFYSLQRELSELSSELPREHGALARSYASQEILPLFLPSPMYRRAHEKPLGYAGDFELMRMYFARNYSGDSFYARFLQYLAQRYPLGQTVQARERVLRQKVLSTLSNERRTRIVALACGPAIELQNVLFESESLKAPVELVLVDQDEQTMHYCHEALSKAVVHRTQDPRTMVELNCINVSVKQILKPATEGEARFISNSLQNADLIYATGLFDYLPELLACNLLSKLYSFLRPEGTVFIGNLKHCPVSTWIMEYVLAWHLQYRSEEDMIRLGASLNPDPVVLRTVLDDTELCVFLEAQKPPATDGS